MLFRSRVAEGGDNAGDVPRLAKGAAGPEHRISVVHDEQGPRVVVPISGWKEQVDRPPVEAIVGVEATVWTVAVVPAVYGSAMEGCAHETGT